jgi:hypothetical protein
MVARTTAAAVGGVAAALVALAGCGNDSGGGSSGGSPTLSITSPSDGADVGPSFEVRWDTSVELGPTNTGRDHAHVFVDGKSDDYTVVGGNEFKLTGLSPGKHEVDVTLQHADHSPAGAEDKIEVNVAGSGASSPSPSAPTTSSSPDSGYGY